MNAYVPMWIWILIRHLSYVLTPTNEPEKRERGSEYSLSCAARERPHKNYIHTHTHEIYSRSMKLHNLPPACHQVGLPGTHGRPDLKTRRSHTHLTTQCGILLPVFRALVFGLALCFGESTNLT